MDRVDVVYYDAGSRLEYDFVVAAGADPRSIGLSIEGIRAHPLGGKRLVLLGHKRWQINNIDAIDLNAYSIE